MSLTGLQDVTCPVMAAKTGAADHLAGVVWGVGMWARVSPAPAKQTPVNIRHLQVLQAWWLRTLGCTPKPCRHTAKPRLILVASLVAAEDWHVPVEQGVSLFCFCVCTFLQTARSKVTHVPRPSAGFCAGLCRKAREHATQTPAAGGPGDL